MSMMSSLVAFHSVPGQFTNHMVTGHRRLTLRFRQRRLGVLVFLIKFLVCSSRQSDVPELDSLAQKVAGVRAELDKSILHRCCGGWHFLDFRPACFYGLLDFREHGVIFDAVFLAEFSDGDLPQAFLHADDFRRVYVRPNIIEDFGHLFVFEFSFHIRFALTTCRT